MNFYAYSFNHPDSLLDGDPNSQPADENVDFTRASQDTSTPKSRQQGKQEDQGKKTSQTIPVKGMVLTCF